MAQPKFTIFVSSTFEDLREERDQVMKAILELGHIPVGMELFSAADDAQWPIITRQIDDCDYYIVIVAHKYGSMSGGISYTEKEYDYAVSKGIPTLGFVLNQNALRPGNSHETEAEKIDGLSRFKGKVKSKLVSFWSDKGDLNAKVAVSLVKAFSASPRRGWIRAQEDVVPTLLAEVTRLIKEREVLLGQLAEAKIARPSSVLVEVEEATSVLRGMWRRLGVRLKEQVGGKVVVSEEKEVSSLQVFRILGPAMIQPITLRPLCDRLSGTLLEAGLAFQSSDIELLLGEWQLLDLANDVSDRNRKVPPSNLFGMRSNGVWVLSDLGRQAIKTLHLEKIASDPK